MKEAIASMSPGAVCLTVIGLLLALASFINTIGSAVDKVTTAWRALTAPDRQQSEDIRELKDWRVKVDNQFESIDKELRGIKSHHEEDMAESREERQLVIFGLLSCLKGLQSQGCNGPVSQAIDKIEKHLNAKAHGK